MKSNKSPIKALKNKLRENPEIISISSRAVYTALVVIATFFVIENMEYTLNLYGIVLIASGVLFTAPFFVTVIKLKNKKIQAPSVWFYVIKDFLCVTLVGVFSSLIFDLVNAVRFELTEYTGLVTMLLSLIYLMITICFIPLYLFFYRKNKSGR